MKTAIKKPWEKKFLFTLILVFLSIYIKAESIDKFFNGVFNDMTKDGNVGMYLVGGILLFGFIVVIAEKIISKYTKENINNQSNIRRIAHRHRHHHQQKKSA